MLPGLCHATDEPDQIPRVSEPRAIGVEGFRVGLAVEQTHVNHAHQLVGLMCDLLAPVLLRLCDCGQQTLQALALLELSSVELQRIRVGRSFQQSLERHGHELIGLMRNEAPPVIP